MTKRVRLLLVALIIAGAIPVVLFGGLLVYPLAESRLRSQMFDAEEWRLSPVKPIGEAWPKRLRMVDDLIESRRLDGLDRSAVETLLGPGDDIEFFRECSRRADDLEWDVGYRLGPQRGSIVRIDNDWLLLDTDSTNRVRRILVTHD